MAHQVIDGSLVRRSIKAIFALILTISTIASNSQAQEERPTGAPIPLGKWVGFLQVDGRSEAIAMTMDSFIVKPAGIAHNPRMAMLFKLNLGGYQSAEYTSELFGNPNYDFDQGLLTLDDPRNELMVTAFVYDRPTEIKGRAFLRSSAQWANLYLHYQTDEPGGAEPTEPTPPLAPTLAGQYEGLCGDKPAVIQIETVRALKDEAPQHAAGLYQYHITGALGVVNGRCSAVNGEDRPAWCIDHGFSSGTYDFFTGKLFLNGVLETTECTRDLEDLGCQVRIVPPNSATPVSATCELHKVNSEVAPFVSHPRRHRVRATAEQRASLPAVHPPFSREVIEAAGGRFSGYLHHEANDRYQPVRLDVSATTSTENPHNVNNVYVSVTSTLYFGAGEFSEIWAMQYDRQPLNLVPGFTLKSDKSDSFLQVTNWSKGFVQGDWYSHQFGRVGTFQVVKDSAFPSLPNEVERVPSIVGTFQGSEERRASGGGQWSLTLMVPNQPRVAHKSNLLFYGNYRLYAGGVRWPTRRIVRGAYDFYSGALGWLIEDFNGDNKLVSGFSGKDGLSLFWPSDRVWSVGVLDWELGSFQHFGD